MHLKLIIVVFLLIIGDGNVAFSKEINLVSGKDTIVIIKGEWTIVQIGLTTVSDTIIYNHKDKTQLGYEIHEIGSDSITVKKPKVYHDTTIAYEKALYPPYLQGSRFKKHQKKNSIHYDTRMVIDEYEYKTFAYKDITSIQYPPKGSIPQTGCIMCVLMPPIYPILIHQNNLRSVPRSYSMREWKIFLVVE